VPTTGWREFRGPSGRRQAFQFHQAPALFAFAGIWDVWVSPEGHPVRSFAIVTVEANDSVRPIHDRMPLRVDPASYASWLDPLVPGARALATVRARAERPLAVYEANPKGNDVRREGPECIAPASPAQRDLFNQ
jgi:putative SOS response-associated peptidase YedK